MVERCVRDAEAAGSSPVTSTSREPRRAIRVLRFFFFYGFNLAFEVVYKHLTKKVQVFELGLFLFILLHITSLWGNIYM